MEGKWRCVGYFMVSSGSAAAGFIEKYRIAGGAAQLLALSGADIEQLSKRLSPEQMQGVAIAQVTPSPYKVSNPLVKEFTDTAARIGNLEVPVSYAMPAKIWFSVTCGGETPLR